MVGSRRLIYNTRSGNYDPATGEPYFNGWGLRRGLINNMDKKPVQRFALQDIPEFQRFKNANPQNSNIDSLQAILMYGRAIHWISILDIIWPDFEIMDYYIVEVAYIVINDPDEKDLPPNFFQDIAQMIAMFWKLQLENKYPSGNWSVDIDDDHELSVRAEIHSRK